MAAGPMKCHLFETDAGAVSQGLVVKTLKVGLIGPSKAGKSEFVKYFIRGNKNRCFEITGACRVRGIRVNYDEDALFILDVYEFRGSKAQQLEEVSNNAMDVYFLMYDVSSEQSFKEVKYQWLIHLYETDIFSFVIGNKSDVNESSKVSTSVPDVSEMAWHSGHIEVSAITGKKIDSVVQRTAEILLDMNVTNKADQLGNLQVSCLSVSDEYDGIPSYDMSGHCKGLCVIINNQEFPEDESLSPRDGSQHDVTNLRELFQQLGFQVKINTNLSKKQMKTVLRCTASSPDLTTHKAFVCVILSHGTTESVYGANSKLIPVIKIAQKFTAKQCPSLIGKPKLFFIQACRGNKKQESVRVQTDHASVDRASSKTTIPNEADFLVAYSTVEGCVSFRDPTFGSIFICLLVECLSNFGNLNLVDVLTILNDKASTKDFPGDAKQMTCFRSTLRQRLILM